MKRTAALVLLAVFTLVWGGWVAIDLLGSILGDCFEDVRCHAIKAYAPGLVLWRGLAVELAALLAYFLYSRAGKQ